MSGNLHQGLNRTSRDCFDVQVGSEDGLAAILCDARGLVLAVTPPAQVLLDSSGPLQLDTGLLTARCGPDLSAIIATVAAGTTGTRTLLLHGQPGPASVLTITPLGRLVQGQESLVLVTAPALQRGDRDPERALQASFGLTVAEAAIAADRGVSPGTLKSQIKSIYQKVGVTRELELATCLASLV